MAAIFACIVQPKVIEFNVSDQKLHRAQKDEELRRELEALQLPPQPPITATATAATASASVAAEAGGERQQQPREGLATEEPLELRLLLTQQGGGCRLLSGSPSVSVASVGSAVCVFEGSLTNAISLAEDYAPLPEDEPTPEPAALSNAQLMCHMYSKVGVEMLGLLRGAFTFVLYESKTSRVLAARDGSGRSPLFQARSGTSGGLVLSNSSELLEDSGCTDKLEFLPGDYKYGWSATPRRYQPSDHVRLSRRSLDLPASAHHHHHHGNGNGNGRFHGPNGPGGGGTPQGGNSRSGSRRNSLDLQHHQNNNSKGQQDNSSSATVAVQVGNRAGGRHHNRGHPSQKSQQQPTGAPGTGTGPHFLQTTPQPAGGSHPHRTYLVSAEDPRIWKASAARQQQQPQVSNEVPGVVGAATTPASSAGVWTASARAPGAAAAAAAAAAAGGDVGGVGRSKDKDKGQGAQGQEGGGNGRGGSARGASSGHHNRRRSMDNHGAWRLGSGQSGPSSPGPIAAAAAAAAIGRQQAISAKGVEGEQQPQKQQQGAAKESPQEDQKVPQNGGGAGVVVKQQQQVQVQVQVSTPGNGRSRRRSSIDGCNTSGKQHQKQPHTRTNGRTNGQAAEAGSQAAEAVVTAAVKVYDQARARTALRVDAAEFVCNQTAAVAASTLGPLLARAVVSAP